MPHKLQQLIHLKYAQICSVRCTVMVFCNNRRLAIIHDSALNMCNVYKLYKK